MHVRLLDEATVRSDAMRALLLLADEQWCNVEEYLGRSRVYGMYSQGELVAECCLTDEGSDTAEIQNLAVAPRCWRQGVGAQMVAFVLRRCRGRFARLRVRTGDSPLTVHFYERCGFTRVETLENDLLLRYDHPIVEGGAVITDTAVFEQEVPAFRPPTRLFTADLHIGDKAIARWRGFARVEDHDEVVLGRLEERLCEDDELWILGDVCRPRVEDLVRLRAAIPCAHVHVIIGNHDKRSKFMTAGGFETVEYYAHVGKVRREGYRFVLSQYPMLDWERAYHGSYMLHGHIHSLPAYEASRTQKSLPPDRNHGGMGISGYNAAMAAAGTRRYDVGLDANDMAPVTADEIRAALPSDEAWSLIHGLSVD